MNSARSCPELKVKTMVLSGDFLKYDLILLKIPERTFLLVFFFLNLKCSFLYQDHNASPCSKVSTMH